MTTHPRYMMRDAEEARFLTMVEQRRAAKKKKLTDEEYEKMFLEEE